MLGNVFAEENGTLPCEIDQIIDDHNISMAIIGNPFPIYGQDSYEKTLRQL